MTPWVLMRHGDTKRFAKSDAERVLSDRGQKEAASVSQQIRGHGMAISHVLCSSAVRARQTLEAMGLTAASTQLSETLYSGDLASINNEIAIALNEAECLLVIMHMPTIVAVAHYFGADVPTFGTAQAVIMGQDRPFLLLPKGM